MAKIVGHNVDPTARAQFSNVVAIETSNDQKTSANALVFWDKQAATWDSSTAQYNGTATEDWDLGATTFSDTPTLWIQPPPANWGTDPARWSDTINPFDNNPPARIKQRAIFRAPLFHTVPNAIQTNADAMYQAGIAWRTIGDAARFAWRDYATARVLASRTNAWRASAINRTRVTTRNSSGFALFLQEYHNAGRTIPQLPNDITREAPVQILELLTGADFEQRLSDCITTTTGRIKIAVYQASANWGQSGIPKSTLFDQLIAAGASGRTCKMVMATPLPGSPPLTFNVDARDQLTAAGWAVRFAPAAPLLHAKFWLVAPGFSIVGSHNLSNRALTSNIETSLLTNKIGIFDALETKFDGLYASGT